MTAAFLDDLRRRLPGHAEVLSRLVAGVESDERWRWLELSCSVATGRDDEWSDLDVGVGVACEGEDDLPVAEAETLVRSLGEVTDLLVHRIEFTTPHRRFAVELTGGVQIDLVIMPAGRRPGLPPGAVALVDKDGTLAVGWRPDVIGPPSAVTAREWAFLGWWALSDVAKYLARGAVHKAAERLAEARRRALQLHASAEGVEYPLFGLTSILDAAEPPLPDGLDPTYAAALDPPALHRAALATVELLRAAITGAEARLGHPIDVPLAGSVTTRLAAAPVRDAAVAPLSGAIVMLRAPAVEDVPILAGIRRSPEVYERWHGGDDLVAAVDRDMAEPGVTAYVIEVDGRVAGWIQWGAEDEPDYRHADIDIYLDPAIHGQGVGTDAVRTLARHLIGEHGYHRLVIDPAADNATAIAAYAKVGFRPVGVMRQYERGTDGTWHDGLLMDLLADDLAE